MNLSNFSYILENLSLYNPSMISIIIGIIIGIAFFILMKMAFLYSYGYFLMREDASMIADRKKTL